MTGPLWRISLFHIAFADYRIAWCNFTMKFALKFPAMLALMLLPTIAFAAKPEKPATHPAGSPASRPAVVKDLAAELAKVPPELIPAADAWTLKSAGPIDAWLKQDLADATLDIIATVESVRKTKDGGSIVATVAIGRFDKWSQPIEKVLMQVTVPKEAAASIAHLSKGDKFRMTHAAVTGISVNLNINGIVGAKDAKVKSLNVILNVNATGVRAAK